MHRVWSILRSFFVMMPSLGAFAWHEMQAESLTGLPAWVRWTPPTDAGSILPSTSRRETIWPRAAKWHELHAMWA